MDDLQQLRLFREVVARGSFTRAAQAHGLSKATVTKSVAQLERDLGVRLLHRSTRSVTPTDAGQTLAERLVALLRAADDLHGELAGYAAHPRGRLRISAPHGLSLNALGKNIEDFIRRYPDIHVSLHLSNREDNLVVAGIDVALRIGPIESDSLIVRKLQPVPMVLCAAPFYWAMHGKPARPEDLQAHEFLTYSFWDPIPRLPFVIDGETRFIGVRSRIDADDAAPLINLAAQGLGPTCLPEVLVRAHLRSGALEPALQDCMPESIWLYAAYAHRRHKSAALRALLDFLEPTTGGNVRT